jgi:hypothetical protein
MFATWKDGLNVWNTETGKPALPHIGIKGRPQQCHWSSNGNIIAYKSEDGIKLIRIKDGAVIRLDAFVVDDKPVGLAYTDTGLFCGDEGAFRFVKYRVGDDLRSAEIRPAEQFMSTHYRADLMADFLAGKPLVIEQKPDTT